MSKAKFLYRYDGKKITDGWKHPVTKVVYKYANWFDSQSPEQLAAINVTRHEWPSVPAYDSYYQKPVEQPSGEYIIEDLPLADVKTKKKAEINNKRNQLETAGFLYQGKKFDSDQRSADRMQVAALAAQAALNTGSEFSVTWTVQDNTTVTLDAAGVLGMVAAFAQYGAGVFEQAKALKAQVDSEACDTGAKVKAVEWPE